MNYHHINGIGCLFAAMAVGFSHASAANRPPKEPIPQIELTTIGNQFLTKYQERLDGLRKDIIKDIPQIDEGKKAVYLKLRQVEVAAEAKAKAADKELGQVNTANALVDHAKNKWIGGAEKKIAEAEVELKKATTEAARETAQKNLATSQSDKESGIAALKTRQENLDRLKRLEPQMIKDLKSAQDELTVCKAASLKAVKELNLEPFLASDKLDDRLVDYVLLAQATPRGLAEFAQQGEKQAALLEKLFADRRLMKQMLFADGAEDGKYGRAMEIYTAIQEASPKASEGVLQRLALAISLELAVPVKQNNPDSQTDAPATLDPVKRYLHFEKAFINGELDPAFKDLTVWDYRNAVNGDEPENMLAWGREMLRNYRPDHVYNPDPSWRYVEAVATEVMYGSQDTKYDRPELQSYQNIIMNGGICGRRAFFGRYILRCFGIPTLARPQTAHATLVHWTPKGWVICLGAPWGFGRIESKSDIDFLAMTQARMTGDSYIEVLRAHWIGDVLGEKRAYGFVTGTTGIWNEVALYHQRSIIEKSNAIALAAVGTDIGEANESKTKAVVKTETMTEADRTIVTGQDGVITIPAVACSKPTNSTGRILFMKSYLGGMQLHYNRMGPQEDFEYTINVPAAGKYALTARVVTTSANQNLMVAVNDAKSPIDIAVPFTIGMWDKTPPVELSLVKGPNVLRFSRSEEKIKGLTIKDFTLTPMK